MLRLIKRVLTISLLKKAFDLIYENKGNLNKIVKELKSGFRWKQNAVMKSIMAHLIRHRQDSDSIPLPGVQKKDMKSDDSALLFALSIAGYSYFYKAISKLLKKLKIKNEILIYFVSGSMASFSFLLDGKKSRVTTISQIVFVRTLYFVIRAFVYSSPSTKRSIPPEPSKIPTRSSVLDRNYTKDRFGDDGLLEDGSEKTDSVSEKKPVLKLRKSSSKFINFLRNIIHRYGEYTTWSLAAFQICYLCFSAPDHVTPSFFESLIHVTASKKRLGSKASQIVKGMSNINGYLESLPERHPIELLPPGTCSKSHIEEWMEKGDDALIKVLIPISPVLEQLSPEMRHERLLCSIQHPGSSSCLYGAIATSRDVFQQLWKTYVFLNCISFAISEAQPLFSSSRDSSRPPLHERIKKSLITIVRNTLMVSSYVGVFSYFLCILRSKFPGREYLLNYGIAGLLACPTIYIDKPGRLTELNAFVVSKMIESFIITLRLREIIKYSRFIEMCLMVPTYGILSVIIERYSYAMKGFTVPILKWLYQ